MRYAGRVFTGPDGPLQPELTWPEGICGAEIGVFRVVSGFGRDVPQPEAMRCTKDPHQDGVHFCELEWLE